MSSQSLEEFVKAAATDVQLLVTREELALRENLRRLEEKCRVMYEQWEDKDLLNKRVWTYLIHLSIEHMNAELALVLVAKLKQVQLALLLQSKLHNITKSKASKTNELIALAYVANHFHIDQTNLEENIVSSLASSTSHDHTLFDLDPLVEYFIDGDQWTQVLDIIATETPLQYEYHKELNKRRVMQKLARHLEIAEEFQEALERYEESGTGRENSLRVILKHRLNLAYPELKRYCIARDSLHNFWLDFSLISGDIQFDTTKLVAGDESIGSVIRSYCARWRGRRTHKQEGREEAERSCFAALPERMRNFLVEVNNEKWRNRRNIESMISMSFSLSKVVRASLAELAEHFHQAYRFSDAGGLYLALNQIDTLLHLAPRFLPKVDCLQLACRLANPDKLTTHLIMHLSSSAGHIDRSSSNMNLSRSMNSNVLFQTYLKLGLIDEALRIHATILAEQNTESDKNIVQAIEFLENLIENRHLGALEGVDPEIQGTTFKSVRECLIGGQAHLSTNVITTVIFSVTIFLFKLDTTIQSFNAPQPISKLEAMFENLCEYLGNENELKFSGSAALTRATNLLVVALKEKIDAVMESDPIRENFRLVVETIANRCMIEGQYRSAAMLYGQIEDNKSAIKCLMRTGDVDVVINYALLVRDNTVNRITINYLKHLDVNSAIIEDFAVASKLS